MKRTEIGKVLNIVVLICVIIIFLGIVLFTLFVKDVFQYQTTINGIDCSFLSISKAKSKMEKVLNSSTITLTFADNKQYQCLGAFFEFKLDSTDALRETMKEQKNGENKELYSLPNIYEIDEEKVREYLSTLSVFNDKNTTKPKNAYLKYDKEKKQYYIEPEVYGNEIKLDEAVDYMINALKSGKTTIDFREITNMTPDILSNDKKLISQMEEINLLLATNITYKLHDKSTYSLNADTLKNWVKKGKDGYYNIKIEDNIEKFVDKLSEKANYQLTSTKFKATGIGQISIAFGRKTYSSIDKEAEIKRLKETLEAPGKTVTWDVKYKLPDYTNLSTYIELDLSRQRVWMYVDEKCILDTPCVTGNVAGGYSTPVGIYYLTYKTMNTTLEGYNSDGSKYSSPVTFWMPFNGGIGFHDASWRYSFGGNIYMTNGSHGCVNLPYWAAQTLYNNINTSIPIILYAS